MLTGIALGVQGWLFPSQQVCKTLQPHQCLMANYATAHDLAHIGAYLGYHNLHTFVWKLLH